MYTAPPPLAGTVHVQAPRAPCAVVPAGGRGRLDAGRRPRVVLRAKRPRQHQRRRRCPATRLPAPATSQTTHAVTRQHRAVVRCGGGKRQREACGCRGRRTSTRARSSRSLCRARARASARAARDEAPVPASAAAPAPLLPCACVKPSGDAPPVACGAAEGLLAAVPSATARSASIRNSRRTSDATTRSTRDCWAIVAAGTTACTQYTTSHKP